MTGRVVWNKETRHCRVEAPVTVDCTQDGNMVLALIGSNIQEGVAGSGATVADALRDLAENIETQVLPGKQ